MTTAKRRRLRPWVWRSIEFTTGAMFCLTLIMLWCFVIEAVCGFNPLWLLGAM